MTFIIVLHMLVCLFLIFVILLQPGKSDGGIGFGSSSSQSIFGSKGAGNFLTKTTSVCAVLFLLTSFVLTRSQIKGTQSSPEIEKLLGTEEKKAIPAGDSAATTPAAGLPVTATPAASGTQAGTQGSPGTPAASGTAGTAGSAATGTTPAPKK